MRAATVLAVVLLGLALLGACGGSDPEYSLAATFACLEADGVPVTHHLDDTDYFVFDPIARAARGGALHATMDLSSVIVAFERSEDAAKRAEAGYRGTFEDMATFEHRDDDVLQRRRNAVVVWLRQPTGHASAQIERCLTS